MSRRQALYHDWWPVEWLGQRMLRDTQLGVTQPTVKPNQLGLVIRSSRRLTLEGGHQFFGLFMTAFFVRVDSVMGLDKPMLHTKLEFVCFSHCRNNKKEPKNFESFP